MKGVLNHSVTRVYVGLPEEELNTMKTAVLAEMEKARTGGRITGVSMAGKSTSKELMPIGELRQELNEIIYALRSLSGAIVTRIVPDFRAT
tara:strand:+ start:1698 stop:1970 length:273 start_codon:yes stop_codon:yes gene_type:complete